MNGKKNICINISAIIIITVMLTAAYFAGSELLASEGIEIIDVTGDQYKGKMMVITDPSRVFCGVIPEFGEIQGMVVLDIIEEYRKQNVPIIGGMNGGAFFDNGADISYTGMPIGMVISEGEIVYQNPEDSSGQFQLVGFTAENRLITEKISLTQISDMNLRDAVCTDPRTSPFLILDGAITEGLPAESDFGGGKSPRTAIGQREDGAILLLVIDGRQTDSLGATFAELAECMKEHGAVTAAAMTGGTSSQMAFNSELINSPYSPSGPQKCPTAWLILE